MANVAKFLLKSTKDFMSTLFFFSLQSCFTAIILFAGAIHGYSFAPRSTDQSHIRVPICPFDPSDLSSITEGPDGLVLFTVMGREEGSDGIVKYDPATREFVTLIEFDSLLARNVTGKPLYPGTGKLIYGICRKSGMENKGFVYSIDVQSAEVKIEYHFATAGVSAFSGALSLISQHEIMGRVMQGEIPHLFTFDLLTQQFTLHKVNGKTFAGIHTDPVILDSNRIAFLLLTDTLYSIVQYNYRKDEIIAVTDIRVSFSPVGVPVMAGDGNMYVNSYYDMIVTTGCNYMFLKYNPITYEVSTVLSPPDEITVFSTPVSVDQHGNVVGALLYGGVDNCGYIYKYTPGEDSLGIYHEWREHSGGCMTSNVAVLCHSNGTFYGCSGARGRGSRGALWYLNPLTNNTYILAEFEERD